MFFTVMPISSGLNGQVVRAVDSQSIGRGIDFTEINFEI